MDGHGGFWFTDHGIRDTESRTRRSHRASTTATPTAAASTRSCSRPTRPTASACRPTPTRCTGPRPTTGGCTSARSPNRARCSPRRRSSSPRCCTACPGFSCSTRSPSTARAGSAWRRSSTVASPRSRPTARGRVLRDRRPDHHQHLLRRRRPSHGVHHVFELGHAAVVPLAPPGPAPRPSVTTPPPGGVRAMSEATVCGGLAHRCGRAGSAWVGGASGSVDGRVPALLHRDARLPEERRRLRQAGRRARRRRHGGDRRRRARRPRRGEHLRVHRRGPSRVDRHDPRTRRAAPRRLATGRHRLHGRALRRRTGRGAPRGRPGRRVRPGVQPRRRRRATAPRCRRGRSAS